jgi:hypothetical protein
MPDLSELSPEELLGRWAAWRDDTARNMSQEGKNNAKKFCDELLRELRAYRAMRAKAEDIRDHINYYGWVYLGCNAAVDILAAGKEAEDKP